MKNRKTFVGIALLIIVLAIGIGYAAINKTLEITGTATAQASENNFKVVFTGQSTADDDVTVNVTEDSTSATLNVSGLKTKDDTKTATFKVKNESPELKALVTVDTETITNEEFFSVDATVESTDALNPDGETTVTVKVKLEKTPIEEVTGTINVVLDAEAVLGGN